ncbi:hypothetical protein BDY19DRAFT_512815 [Irpex rosettiformis]|uniref:Uncharacterized protein n=1 Tax=Irpex rosettiformis TaxID=378272 RepID=A0ACB8UEP3_9APHY|nr:hypothetical protein BDY19DRAFT_512815 [Irpex rosettiformis]
MMTAFVLAVPTWLGSLDRMSPRAGLVLAGWKMRYRPRKEGCLEADYRLQVIIVGPAHTRLVAALVAVWHFPTFMSPGCVGTARSKAGTTTRTLRRVMGAFKTPKVEVAVEEKARFLCGVLARYLLLPPHLHDSIHPSCGQPRGSHRARRSCAFILLVFLLRRPRNSLVYSESRKRVQVSVKRCCGLCAYVVPASRQVAAGRSFGNAVQTYIYPSNHLPLPSSACCAAYFYNSP